MAGSRYAVFSTRASSCCVGESLIDTMDREVARARLFFLLYIGNDHDRTGDRDESRGVMHREWT